jgi:hypothetical protein
MRLPTLALLLTGCGHAPPSSTTAAGPRVCEQVAGHLLALLQPEGAAPDTVETIRHAIGQRCSDDQWTLDATQCFRDTTALERTDRCAPLLTIPQRNALEQAIAGAVGPTSRTGR